MNVKDCPFVVREKVYLRPPSGNCQEQWSGPHTITNINSPYSVELNEDGISRHTSHLRSTVRSSERTNFQHDDSGSSSSDDDAENQQQEYAKN